MSFKVGDKVKMRSALTSIATGLPFGWVHGTVCAWPDGGPNRMLVEWNETGLVTALPNPAIVADDGKRD